MCFSDLLLSEDGFNRILWCPERMQFFKVSPALPPAYLNRLEVLPGRRNWINLLNTAYPNQNINCFQAPCANVPSLPTSHDHIFERGAPVFVGGQDFNTRPTGNHGSASRQYIASPIRIEDGGIGAVDLAREASRTTIQSELDPPFSSYAPSNQDNSDQFLSAQTSGGHGVDDVPPHIPPASYGYTHHRIQNMWNVSMEYQKPITTYPDEHTMFAAPSQVTRDALSFPLNQHGRPASSVVQPININGTIASPFDNLHASVETRLPGTMAPLTYIHRQTDHRTRHLHGNIENQGLEDNDPDVKYTSKPDFTGLTLERPNQLHDYPLAVDEVDDDIPPGPERPVTPSKPHLHAKAPIESIPVDTPAAGPSPNAKPKAKRRGKRTLEKAKDAATRFVTQNLTKAIKFRTKAAKDQYEKNRRIGTCFLCKRRAHKQSCPYLGEDKVCDVCIRRYGKVRAAELCFQYHHEQLTPCNFGNWCKFHEELQNLVPFWRNENEDLTLHLAIGPVGDARVFPIGIDSLPSPGDNEQIGFNIGNLLEFISGLPPSLSLDMTLTEEESILACEAKSCIGLFTLIDQYHSLKYCSTKDKLELGRHLIHGFLRTLLDQFSQKTATLIQRSYDWLMEPREARRRPDVVVAVIAVLYSLCEKQASWECEGRLGKTMKCLQKRASLAAVQLLKFGNAAYDLMDEPFKGRAPPGGFESFAHTILPSLPMHEIHVTYEPSPVEEAVTFSPTWLNSPQMIKVCFGRLLEYQGNFGDLDNLKRFLLSGTPFNSPAPNFRKPFSPAVHAYITDNSGPPFLPSPRQSLRTINRVGTGSSLMDLSESIDMSAGVSSPRKDKGKGRAIDNEQLEDYPGSPEEIGFSLQDTLDIERVIQASLTTENPRHWDSSFSGPSRVTYSNGDSSRR